MSKSVYELVTDKMIEQLEKGIIPWENPGLASDQAHSTE